MKFSTELLESYCIANWEPVIYDALLVAAAVEFLKKAKIGGVYALSLRMQVWLLLPTSKDINALMRRDAEAMLAMTQSRGTARGMHDYTAMGHSYSHSRSQYAVRSAAAQWKAARSTTPSISDATRGPMSPPRGTAPAPAG